MNAILTVPQTSRPAGAAGRRPGAAVLHSVPAVSTDDVCDLIDAAGPLSLCDIAGGLAVSARQAATTVRRMLLDRSLRRDEWGRFRLAGVYALR